MTGCDNAAAMWHWHAHDMLIQSSLAGAEHAGSSRLIQSSLRDFGAMCGATFYATLELWAQT